MIDLAAYVLEPLWQDGTCRLSRGQHPTPTETRRPSLLVVAPVGAHPAPPEVIAGTLAYMALEQTGRMNRSIDVCSDLYALGVMLYEMLTGRLPFTAADPITVGSRRAVMLTSATLAPAMPYGVRRAKSGNSTGSTRAWLGGGDRLFDAAAGRRDGGQSLAGRVQRDHVAQVD